MLEKYVAHHFFHLHILAVADPGFSPGVCANSQNCNYFSNFCRKLHENEKIWTPGGHTSLAPPLGSANVLFYSAIHKAAGLTVHSHSTGLPGIIPKISKETAIQNTLQTPFCMAVGRPAAL